MIVVDRSLVVLSRFATSFEAQTLSSRLATAGIESFIQGTDLVAAFGIGGAPSASGVRLEVAEEDLQAAVAILQKDERVRELAGQWHCSRCDELNESTFELCWSCQKSRGDDGLRADESGVWVSSDADAFVDSAPVSAERSPETNNPYQPVLISDDMAQAVAKHHDSFRKDDEGKSFIGESDERHDIASEEVRSLTRLTGVAALIFPLPLCVYGVARTTRAITLVKDDPKLRFRVRVYLVINILVCIAVSIFWLSVINEYLPRFR